MHWRGDRTGKSAVDGQSTEHAAFTGLAGFWIGALECISDAGKKDSAKHQFWLSENLCPAKTVMLLTP